jgi:RimJ/RimL family protein N-acetyltransferase
MQSFPTLTTERLVLRQFATADAPAMHRLLGAPEIAASTFVPHPYEDGMAEQWITHQHAKYEQGRQYGFAIVLAAEQILIGAISLMLTPAHDRGRLGYWIGVPYWNQGYCTEAARAVVQFGFHTLGLHRIWAPHFGRNPASGSVLQKIGMQYEGCQRGHFRHGDRFEDAMLYGILHHDVSLA